MAEPKLIYVEAVLMPNGEVIHMGKTLGFVVELTGKPANAEAEVIKQLMPLTHSK